jgi:hypothetical protein
MERPDPALGAVGRRKVFAVQSALVVAGLVLVGSDDNFHLDGEKQTSLGVASIAVLLVPAPSEALRRAAAAERPERVGLPGLACVFGKVDLT